MSFGPPDELVARDAVALALLLREDARVEVEENGPTNRNRRAQFKDAVAAAGRDERLGRVGTARLILCRQFLVVGLDLGGARVKDCLCGND
jgi:hypothetical protein